MLHAAAPELLNFQVLVRAQCRNTVTKKVLHSDSKVKIIYIHIFKVKGKVVVMQNGPFFNSLLQ